jgi:hypothetical protein
VDPAAVMNAITARQEIVTRALQQGLKSTSASMWLDYGEKADPRPEDEAAVAIAAVFGISYEWVPMGVGNQFWLKEDYSGPGPGHFLVTVQIRGTGFGRTVTEIGTCASNDPLLSKGPRAFDGVATDPDVRKKAMANALVRLLQALILRSVTWEMLEKAGVRRAECQKVVFGESGDSQVKRETREAAGEGKPCPKCAKEPCPKCKSTGKPGVMRLRPGKGDRGPFLGCSHYDAVKENG